MSGAQRFYADHVAGGPTHIVMAIAAHKNGHDHLAVFSSLEKAEAWADSLEDDEYYGVTFAPGIIDVPEYGNVPKGAQQ
jgi:hypothetical protein